MLCDGYCVVVCSSISSSSHWRRHFASSRREKQRLDHFLNLFVYLLRDPYFPAFGSRPMSLDPALT